MSKGHAVPAWYAIAAEFGLINKNELTSFRKPILLSVIASIVLFSGCASITSGKQQNISVKAICDGKPVTGAQCELTNDKGSWFTNTPGSVGIHKSYGDMTVTCTKGDAKGVATFASANEGSVWGNVIAGGIIGYAVDANTGAGFSYQPVLQIKMEGSCPKE